jgi:hypothetical protein
MKSTVINSKTIAEKKQRKYNIPVIAHFKDKSIRFNSITEAENFVDANYHLIYEACIGKIKIAGGAYWEYESGTDYIKYKAISIRYQQKYTRVTGFNG